MAKQKGSDGQIRKTTAEWAADTSTYPEGMRLMDTETGVVRVSKGTTYALAWVPSSGEGGGQVNTVGWTSQYGMSANTSGTTSVLIQPVGTESIIKTIAQIGHGLTLGQPVRMNGGAYVAAQGNSAANAAYVGFVLEVVSANQFRLLTAGHSAGAPAAMFSGLTAGTAAYLSPSSAGALTNTPNAFGPVLMPTSTTAGYVLSNAGNSGASEYVATLAQSGTNAPVATVLKNTLGAIVWSRSGPGVYSATLVGAFTNGVRTLVELDTQKALLTYVNDGVLITASRSNADVVSIDTSDSTDDWISSEWLFRITVYPA